MTAIKGEKTLSDQSDLEPLPAARHVYKLNTDLHTNAPDPRGDHQILMWMNKFFPSTLREHDYEPETA